LAAALHVHSTASSGEFTVVELARMARSAGLDALVLTENFGYEFRYAPAPFRPFLEARMSTPTIERYGLSRYLTDVEAARRAEPAVTILVGVEVPPYYYWTGGLLSGDLTLNDMQRNLLVIPPTKVGDVDQRATFLSALPAVGNRLRRRWGPGSLLLIVPASLVILLSLGVHRRLRHRPSRRRSAVLVAMFAAATTLLIANYPFTVAPTTPYDGEAAPRHVRAMLDYVRSRGGLSFWSMPEAVDYRSRSIGPVVVELSTHPYPEVLTEVAGGTGFGGAYADTVSTIDAGAEWDNALRAFQAGTRESAPWLVGETAFHYADHAGKKLEDVLTVLLVEDRTPAAMFNALAAGSAYAVRRGDANLRLPEFALDLASGHTARQGQTLAVVGNEATAFDIRLEVDDLVGSQTPVTIEVVRGGDVVRVFDAMTPLRETFTGVLDADEDAAYYRVIVRAEHPSYLVSNPIFVRRTNPGESSE
jgi:hypothetical protein